MSFPVPAINEVIIGNMEDPGKGLQLQVCDIPLIRFDPGDHILIHVIACKLEQVGEIPLGIIVLFPKFDQLAADEVLFTRFSSWFWHMASS